MNAVDLFFTSGVVVAGWAIIGTAIAITVWEPAKYLILPGIVWVVVATFIVSVVCPVIWLRRRLL